jgi:hypothetical protein
MTSCKTGQKSVQNDQKSQVSAAQIRAENESDIYIENQQFLNEN